MPCYNDYPNPRSRLGAAVHGFFHPNEAYSLGRRTASAERDADYYPRSARNSEERAFSAERERNSATGNANVAHRYRVERTSIVDRIYSGDTGMGIKMGVGYVPG